MDIKSPGYILLHRSLKEHWIWKNPKSFQRWIYLLMEANYEDKEQQSIKTLEVITIQRGELWTTLQHLAAAWKCSRGTVVRFLQMLEREKMISYRGDVNGTFIKVLNYEVYQDFRGVSCNTERNAKRSDNGTQTERRRVTPNTSNTLVNTSKTEIEPPAFGGEWE